MKVSFKVVPILNIFGALQSPKDKKLLLGNHLENVLNYD